MSSTSFSTNLEPNWIQINCDVEMVLIFVSNSCYQWKSVLKKFHRKGRRKIKFEYEEWSGEKNYYWPSKYRQWFLSRALKHIHANNLLRADFNLVNKNWSRQTTTDDSFISSHYKLLYFSHSTYDFFGDSIRLLSFH